MFRAGDGIRTRDIQLGRLELYQLSYTRMANRAVEGGGFEPPKCMHGRFTVCSLWPLGHSSKYLSRLGFLGAGGGTRTRDLLITSQVLYQLSYASDIGREAADV